jgi:hypothetical protein
VALVFKGLVHDRILWLKIANVLSEEEVRWLEDVHNTRKQYYHHWSKEFDEIDVDALRCLGNMSRLASNHLELLNKNNINKIKEYHKSLS